MARGSLILHGGGEALPGDEPVALEALRLASTASASTSELSGRSPLRVAIVPVATARGNPARTTAHVAAFLVELSSGHGLRVEMVEAPVVDRASAEDRATTEALATAALIVIPGGDPDLVPIVLSGTRAWLAILEARSHGAVIWGASAGAMALATWCWTPAGGVDGLGLLPGLVVAPHVTDPNATDWLARLAARPPSLGVLTLAERTAVVGPLEPVATDDPAPGGASELSVWRCVGAGVAAWIPAGATAPATRATHGELLRLPG
jgi:cyanophycinase-like exopeptidase